jgi:hypothetical protein
VSATSAYPDATFHVRKLTSKVVVGVCSSAVEEEEEEEEEQQ